MKKRLANNILLICGLLILLYIVNQYGFDNLWANLNKTGFWILPVIGIWFIVYIFNNLAFRFVIKPYNKDNRIPFFKSFAIVLSGYSLNYITPVVALGGEIFKINSLKEYIGVSKAASSVAQYYIMHVLSHIVFWVLGLLLMVLNIEGAANNYKLIIGIPVFISVLAFLFMLIIKKGILVKAYELLLKLHFSRKITSFLLSKDKEIRDIDKQIRNFYMTYKKEFYMSWAMEFCARLTSSAEIMFILWSIGINFTYFQSVYFFSISSLFLNLLFFIPLQMGAREGIYYMLIKTVGISSPIGIYLGLISRIREMFWILVGVLIIPFTKNKKHDVNSTKNLVNEIKELI